MYARANGISPEIANEVSKQLSSYELAKKHAEENEVINIEDYVDNQYQDLVKGCQKYLGIYDNMKGHPCACLAYDGDIESDIGVVLCKSEATGNKVLTAVIESGTIDAFGYLKQDYLIVDSIGLTYDIYKEIGIKPYSVNQLLEKIKDDKNVWDIYANGYTQCVNQCEQQKSTEKVMRYKPKNISELTQFVAGIRPSFQSMYHKFENREHFEYGIKALDQLLQDEYCSSSFILYQESLMKVLEFAGFPMSETYTIIKAISKKKDYIIKDAKPKFIKNFAEAIISTGETNDLNKANELATEVWTIVENSAAYGFNCVSGDTIIKKPSNNGNFIPTIEEMYKIKHDINYAKRTGHKSLHDKYNLYGYGYGLSMKNGKIYKNKIIDIYKQPKALTYIITTETGRKIKATENHKFPTVEGIKLLKDLKINDLLYVQGEYKKKFFNTRLTNSFENNFPKKGECGFRKKINGDSVVYENYRNKKINLSCQCECCGETYSLEKRFEVHHKDFNRFNNIEDNYMWLCCSCHKKIHYNHGRIKQYENGIECNTEKIISIVQNIVEDVYDVEMSEDIGHNFVTNDGIVTCNSAHAYCMAIDSVTIAYLKAYYPLEFYKVVLQRFTNKGEKNKVSLIKQEMIKRGFNLKEIKFGDDNRQFNIDKENNCIVQTMSSIKDMPKSTPQALFELGQKELKNRAELYQSLINDNRINIKAIDILFKLNYFSMFGSPTRLLKEFEIYKQYIDVKVIQKSKLTDEKINLIRECCGKETEKQFRDIDNKKLISKIIKNTEIKKTTTIDLIKWQIEFLGYTTLSDINFDPNTWIITDIELSSYGTQKFYLYNIHYGASKEYKVDKKWSKTHKAEIGDVIICVLKEKDKFKKSENGSFLKTGEKEIVIKCFKKKED